MSKTEYPERLPLTKPNHRALKIKAAEEGKKIQEAGNELIEEALKSGVKLPPGKRRARK